MTGTEKRKVVARRLKKEGFSAYEISKLFKVHMKTVQKYLMHPDERIVKMYSEGKGIGEIALELGVCEKTVRTHLKQAEMKIPSKKPKKKRDRQADIDAILKAMETCGTQKEIVEKTGINSCRVSNLCREEDLWAKAGKSGFSNRNEMKKASAVIKKKPMRKLVSPIMPEEAVKRFIFQT